MRHPPPQEAGKGQGGFLLLSALPWGPGGEGCPFLPSPVRDIFW